MKNRKVVAVAVADAGVLAVMRVTGEGSVTSVPRSVWRELRIDIPADFQESDKVDDGERLYTSQLTFREVCHEPWMVTHPVFRITLADGTELLMGGSLRPFPQVTYTQQYSSDNGKTQLQEFTATWTSTMGSLIIES